MNPGKKIYQDLVINGQLNIAHLCHLMSAIFYPAWRQKYKYETHTGNVLIWSTAAPSFIKHSRWYPNQRSGLYLWQQREALIRHPQTTQVPQHSGSTNRFLFQQDGCVGKVGVTLHRAPENHWVIHPKCWSWFIICHSAVTAVSSGNRLSVSRVPFSV